MVEDKKVIRFRLKVTKKRMLEVVEKYFPGHVKLNKLQDVAFTTVSGKTCGWLVFHDSYGENWRAYLNVCAGSILLSFDRYDEERFQYSLDRMVFQPDIEYIDLLGMIVRY